MRKMRRTEIRAKMPLIWAVSVFVWVAAFSNGMYGLEIRPVNVTPENLKDYPIIENIIVRDTGRTVVTVVVLQEFPRSVPSTFPKVFGMLL